MRDKLHVYLLERPAGASPRELLDLIFTQPGADPEFGPRFIRTLLAPDSRFVWNADDGTWRARLHDALAAALSETAFVVVDLETTGGTAAASNIIEIGAARIRAGRVIEEFQQLINPGSRLPAFITALTGIDDGMLRTQPAIAAVWPRFRHFLGEEVIVAHNAAFDVGFLNAAALALNGGPLAQPHLCTIRLARRLLPQLRRRSLDMLAAHFGIPVMDRHRALGDVRITVEIFFHLLECLRERGVVRLDQALDLQHHARDGRRFVCRLPRESVERLPAQPGIYRFFDAEGRLLYVGKAKNLRERVASYLSNAAGHSNKTLDLIRHCRDVRVQVTGSELEAALTEAEAIRAEQPPYNRLSKHLPRIAFVKLSMSGVFPRLSVSDKIVTGKARYAGPFRSRQQAEDVLGLLTRQFQLRTCAPRLHPDAAATPCFQGQIGACTAPCAERVSAEVYRRQVEQCVALLDGDSDAPRSDLTRRRDDLAAALRFEAAARVQRDIELLDMLGRRRRTLGWMLARHNFLVLQPGAASASVLAYVVLGGRLAMRRRIYDESQMDAAAADVCAQVPVYSATPLRRDEVDGTTILAAWLRDRGESDGCVFAFEDAAAAAIQVPEWRAACMSLLSPLRVGDSDAPRNQPAAPEPQGQRQSEQQRDPGATGAAVAD